MYDAFRLNANGCSVWNRPVSGDPLRAVTFTQEQPQSPGNFEYTNCRQGLYCGFFLASFFTHVVVSLVRKDV